MSAEIIEVMILDGCVTAREVNKATNPKMGIRHLNYEKSLRTFKITNRVVPSLLGLFIEREGNMGLEGAYISGVGFKHEGEVLTDGKIKII